MKKFLGALILLTFFTSSVYAVSGSSVVTLDKSDIEIPEIGIKDNTTTLNGSLLINNSEDLANLIDTQKEHDLKDLELLWKGTVENNEVIEFALKKLATPESQRRIHSSLMAKTLSAIVTGASFIPSLTGANYGVQTAAFSAGRLAQGLLNKKNLPTETPLTDTELIELAGMVEDLQDSLISSYYNYKNTLSLLKDARSKMLLYSKNYSNAISSKDMLEIAIWSSRYDSMRLREFNLEQAAKKYHIQLQRLAGKKAVDSLELYQYDFDSIMYKDNKETDSRNDKSEKKQKTKGGNDSKNKILSLLIITALCIPCVKALTINDLTSPKDNFYRFGATDTPEKKMDNSEQIDLSYPDIAVTPISIKETKPEHLTYADLSIKSMAMEVSKNLDMDYNEMLEDLSLLWQGAAMKSDTIKFAIYKLSNPDKDKPDDGAIRKVLTTIAGLSTFLGSGAGNPMFAGAALIGGNTLGIMSQDTKALNYKYSQVTDADMIILVRKVDELQQKVVNSYYDYMTARALYNMTSKMVSDREANYKKSQSMKKEVVLVTDTFYREAIDEQIKARGSFFEKRSQLEQLVGNDIFRQFEEVVDNRK